MSLSLSVLVASTLGPFSKANQICLLKGICRCLILGIFAKTLALVLEIGEVHFVFKDPRRIRRTMINNFRSTFLLI